jgi:hypothetical protein
VQIIRFIRFVFVGVHNGSTKVGKRDKFFLAERVTTNRFDPAWVAPFHVGPFSIPKYGIETRWV